MLGDLFGDVMSWAFRMAAKAVLFVMFAGVLALGVGLLTETIHVDDLSPAHLGQTIAACRERIDTVTGFLGEVTKADPVGALQTLHEQSKMMGRLGADDGGMESDDLGSDLGSSYDGDDDGDF
jgi:hypothetical protein